MKSVCFLETDLDRINENEKYVKIMDAYLQIISDVPYILTNEKDLETFLSKRLKAKKRENIELVLVAFFKDDLIFYSITSSMFIKLKESDYYKLREK